jgi:RNase adaptor protein for sRNA GlmZ degradation
MLSLIVISGRSGSGKSTALNVLEDMDYYWLRAYLLSSQ